MIYVNVPNKKNQSYIQEVEQLAYWSCFAEVWFKKWGFIVSTVKPNIDCFTWSARGSSSLHSVQGSVGFFEGPFDKTSLNNFGLVASDYKSETINLQSVNGGLNETFGYSRSRVRRIPRNRNEMSDPYPFHDENTPLDPHFVHFQVFQEFCGWDVLATVWVQEENKRLPVVITDGRRILSGIPIMNLIGHKHWMPSYADGYYDTITPAPHWSVEIWLRDICVNVITNNNLLLIRSRPWPNGKTSALTVRHDHDRKISDLNLNELLRFYGSRKIKASWGFLNKLMPVEQIEKIKNAGHEIVLHSEAANKKELVKEREELRRTTGIAPMGVTCHGGMGSRGYLGGNTFTWAAESGFAYSEVLGKLNFYPHPLLRWDGSNLVVTELYAPPCHFSLDLGTKSDAHALGELLDKIPEVLEQEGCVNIMNHPDIHIEQLEFLLDSLISDDVWLSTHQEQIEWFRHSKFDVHCSFDHKYIKIYNKKQLQLPVVFDIKFGNKTGVVVLDGNSGELNLDTKKIIRNDALARKNLYWLDNEPTAINMINTTSLCIVSQRPEQASSCLKAHCDELELGRGKTFWTASTAGRLTPDLCFNFYSKNFPQKFSQIIIDPNIKLFPSPFAESFICHCIELLTIDGIMLLPKNKLFFGKETVELNFLKKFADFSFLKSSKNFYWISNVRIKKCVRRKSVVEWYLQSSDQIVYKDLKHRNEGSESSSYEDYSTLRSMVSASHAYLVHGVNEKSQGIKNIIKNRSLTGDCLTHLDIGGGIGALVAELALDPTCAITSGMVRDYSSLHNELFDDLVDFYNGELNNRVIFSCGDAVHFSISQKFDIVSIIGTLLYLRSDLEKALENAWDKVAPGGLLIVHENIKNSSYTHDFSKMFSAEELDQLLSGFGKISYHHPSFDFRIPKFAVGNRTVFRVVKK